MAACCILLCIVSSCKRETDAYLGKVFITKEQSADADIVIPPLGTGLPWRLRFSGDFSGEPRLKSGVDPVIVELTNKETYAIKVTLAGGKTVALDAGATVVAFDGTISNLAMSGRGMLAEMEVHSLPKREAAFTIRIRTQTVSPPIAVKIFAVRNISGL